MAKKVRIPTPLRKLTNNEELVEINGTTIGEAIAELQTRYPGIKDRLLDETGAVRRHINIFVNSDHMRDRNGLDTTLAPGDEVFILPAVSGG